MAARKMSVLSKLSAATACLLLLGLTWSTVFAPSERAQAHKGAMGVVKLRMESMKGMADSMKTITKMLRGEIEYNSNALADLGAMIEAQAGEKLTKQFPKGSLDDPTEARPEIWQDWAAFEKSANDLRMAAQNYTKVVKSLQANAKDALKNDPLVAGSFADLGPHLVPPNGEQVKQLQTAVMSIGQTCKSCHEKFRVKKEKK